MDRDEYLRSREARERVRRSYGLLFDRVAEILFRLDPIRLNYGVNPDEYEPEAGTILLRLEQAGSQAEALEIIHQEFVLWFSERCAGPMERYQPVAAEIWTAWLEWSTDHPGQRGRGSNCAGS